MLRLQRLAGIALVLTVTGLAVIGCSSKSERAGQWALTANFGTATLTVSNDGTLITQIQSSINCGAARGAKNTVGAGDPKRTPYFPGWAVDKDGTFDAKDVIFNIVLLGNSDGNALGELSGQIQKDSASGNWQVRVNDGTVCSSSWTGIKTK